ncbi:hypothetical protein [Halovivax gelatinilyticus]|uniref:hypothetical protein n=1 Tax=Halovivax gelatinilyticus TaxID=2961597 RepID=UPI0020CA2CEB|nr:hypothetical protein [Halovivax gelatinilyticus]
MSKTNRRTVLKSVVTSSGVVGSIGSTQVFSVDTGQKDSPGTTIKLDETEPGPQSEWEELANEAPTLTGADGRYDYLNYNGHWTWEFDESVNCGWGNSGSGDGKHIITCYEAVDADGSILRDGAGNYHYIIEMWATAEGDSIWACPSLYIEKLQAEISTDSNGGAVFQSRDPINRTSVNDERIAVSEGHTVGGISYNADSVVRFNDGTFGPTDWVPGPAGTYTVNWEGSETERTDMVAYVRLTSSCKIKFKNGGCNSGLEWTVWGIYNYS